MRTFIFACIHNAGRSQMSAALFNLYADPAKAHAISAGTQPAEHVHPVVLDAMREIGIDLSSATPQKLSAELASMSPCSRAANHTESLPTRQRRITADSHGREQAEALIEPSASVPPAIYF